MLREKEYIGVILAGAAVQVLMLDESVRSVRERIKLF
jgi:hypothetical protein